MAGNWEALTEFSTNTLIELIRKRIEPGEVELAELAFRCICFRFQNEVISNIRVVVRKWGYDLDVADEIAYTAFDRFWKYPKFDPEKCNTGDIDKCFVFYIHKICRRLLINHKDNVNAISGAGEEEIIFDFPVLPNGTGNDKKTELMEVSRKIEKALDKLGPKHKAIFLTYKAYERSGKKLPRTLLEKLRIEFKLSQNTIRFYKKEANEVAQKILNEYGK